MLQTKFDKSEANDPNYFGHCKFKCTPYVFTSVPESRIHHISLYG